MSASNSRHLGDTAIPGSPAFVVARRLRFASSELCGWSRRAKRAVAAVAVLLVALLATAPAIAVPYCYAIADDTQSVVGVDLATGQVIYSRAIIGLTAESTESMVFSQTEGRFYTVDQGDSSSDPDRFGFIDLETGTFTVIGTTLGNARGSSGTQTIGNSTTDQTVGIAQDPTTGFWYGVTHDGYFFRINPTTGTVVLNAFGANIDYVRIRTSGGTNLDRLEDITFDASGQLYLTGYPSGSSQLFTVNKATGVVTSTVNITINGSPEDEFEGLSFGPGGVLYATTGDATDNSANSDRLWSINTSIGVATQQTVSWPRAGGPDYESVACVVDPAADLRISKTNTFASGPNDLPADLYTPGESPRTYTIVVTNAGEISITNAIFTDPDVAGLTETGVTCSNETLGSTCPTAANTTVVLMQGTGIVIPLLTPGGSVRFTVTTSVSASQTSNLINIANIAPPSGVTDPTLGNNTAVDTDQSSRSTVTVTKVSNGGTGAFTFNGAGASNGFASQTITTTAAGSPGTTGATQILAAAGVATTITESSLPTGFALTSISCTGLGSGGTATPTINGTAGGNVVLNAAATAAGSNITCTFTNTKLATLRIVKSVPTGQGTSFDFTQSGMPATASGSPNAATVTSFSLNPSVMAGSSLTATQTYTNIPITGTPITASELNSANVSQYDLVNIVCTDAGATGSTFPTSVNNGAPVGSPAGTATITLVAGADVTCTFNNVRNPHIVIVKNTVGGDGTFTFTETSSAAGTAIDPLGPQVLTTSGGSATFNTMVTGLSGSATTNVTINEQPTAGFTLTSLSCTNLSTGATLTTGTTPSATISGGQVLLGGVATGTQVQCTYVNTRQSSIVIVKDAVPNDAQDFAYTTSGSGLSSFSLDDDSDATLSNTRTFTGLAPGSYTVTETTPLPAGWSLTGLSCIDASGGTTTSGATANIGLAAGDTVTCTYINTRALSDLSVTKTNNVTTLTAGTSTTYTVVATNNGPDAVTGAVVRDPAQAGLICNDPVLCTGSGCPSATVPLLALQSTGGVVLGTVANGGTVSFSLSCAVQ